MKNSDLEAWQKRLDFTYVSAANALGLSRATYARYLKDPNLPQWLALACAALEHNIKPIGYE